MKRIIYLEQIKKHLKIQPICAILGARQVRKTTLARQFADEQFQKVEFFDLENPTHLASLQTPLLTLSQFSDCLVVIDALHAIKI